MVNVHFSLLPRWRGAAPVERAILAGDERTGVCVMGLEEGLDTGPVYGVAFSPDKENPRLATAGWDGTVRIWDARRLTQLHVLKGHEGDVWSVSFGRGGKVVASAGSDSTVRVWDVDTGKELQVFRGSGRGLHAVRFAPDGVTLAAGARDGTVRIWDIGK